MKTAHLLLVAVFLVGAVRGDDNARSERENTEVDLIVTNSTNENLNNNSVKLDSEVKVDNMNNTSEDPESDEKLQNDTSPELSKDKDVEISDEGWEFENKTPVDTRRILNGKKVERGARPYMVYLQSADTPRSKSRNWMCGGVIVHKEYVMTSAACVEDMERSHIVAGTIKKSKTRYSDDECFRKNKRRVIWKCVPKSYVYDHITASNWSVNDIAVVQVDKPFKLGKVEEGCQFAAKAVEYNNISRELEEPGTKGYVLGWGAVGKFRESEYRKRYDDDDDDDKPNLCLQEAKVCLMETDKCAELWPSELRKSIREYMICTKDIEPQMSKICREEYANCTKVPTRRELPGNQTVNSNQTMNGNQTVEGLSEVVDLGTLLRNSEYYRARRAEDVGGFCENDHGGPLMVRYRGEDRVVGVISASKVDGDRRQCHGPFLYTSVFKNRQFLSCVINKYHIDDDCRRVFRAGVTHKEWTVNWDDDE